ncbi:MAG TPA: NUDIX hydrolase [Candidatus Saccharimonadales bacterium]|nr:NUDIX hydrolase [Candidatus Saccharimonadales bacterium]
MAAGIGFLTSVGKVWAADSTERRSPFKFVIVRICKQSNALVDALIFSSDGFILLGKSVSGMYADQWLVPGGGVEPGEKTQ